MGVGTSDGGGYVASFRFDRRTAMTLVGCVVFVAILLWMPTDDGIAVWVIKVAGLLLFGVGGLVVAVMAGRGGVALRVDAAGLMLGNPRISQPGSTNRPIEVPWSDLAEVVLFNQIVVGRSFRHRMPYIGVRLRPGAQAATSFDPDSRLWRISRDLLPHVPEDVLLRSRPVSGWRLDEPRVCENVTRHAPDVRVVRLDETGEPSVVCPPA
jgi:hypothetical protein